jgi:hypothetical protein
VREVQRGYAGITDRPLSGYAGALGAYGVFTGALVGISALRGKRLPGKVRLGDAALLSLPPTN